MVVEVKCSLDMSLFYRKTRGLVNRSVHKTPTFIIEPKICQLIEEYLSECDFLPTDVIRLSNMETIVALVAAGIGVGFVPELGLDSIAKEYSSKISSYILEDMPSCWQIASVKRKGSFMCTYEKEFVEMAKQILK